MNEDYIEIRKTLIGKRDELTARLESIKENITGGRSADSQEQAQELENAEVVDALGNEARIELSQIARALEQMKNGNFGICVNCDEEIPIARLKAHPFASLCIRCATVAEQQNR